MNANELADELINWYPKVNLCVASAITLRQQNKEIEVLKKVLKEIIDISDRKHDVWDEAKELLQKASEK